MNSYGVNAQADARACTPSAVKESEKVADLFNNRLKALATKPAISTGHPSLYDTYAREQSPLSDEEMREAAEFHFGVALDAS